MNKKLQNQKHNVEMYNINTKKIEVFDSISQAKRKTGFSKSSIYRSIKTGNKISKNREVRFENTTI